MKTHVKNLSPHEVIKTLEVHEGKIHRYGVKRIGLFGSFLKKKSNKRSDMDFLVAFKKPTFDNYMELKFFLEKLFHKKVDLVVEDNLKPALRYVKREALYA